MKLNQVTKDNQQLLVIGVNEKEQLKELFNQYINGLTPEGNGSIKVDCDEFFEFVRLHDDKQ